MTNDASSVTGEQTRTIGGYNEELLRAYVGIEKEHYYLPRFRIMGATGSKVSWNWAAFFVLPMWLAYRKAILYGWLAFVAQFAVGLVPGGLGSALFLLSWLAGGMFGNYLYFMDIKQKIVVARQYGHDDAGTASALRDIGGSSWNGHVIAMICLAVLSFILSLFHSVLGWLLLGMLLR